MNRVLLSKELRALAPFAACILALNVVGWIYLLATEAPDAQHFSAGKWLEHSRSGSLAILALFSLLLGAGLLVRESEDRTLFFLDGLPVSRTRIFFMKLLAALLVVSIVPLLDVGTEAAFGWMSRNSLDGPYPWNFICVEIGLLLLAGAYLIGLALLVSFTRAWFALVSGLLLLIYVFLRGRGSHWLAFFDTYEMLGVAYVNGKALVSWRHVAAHAATIAGCLAVAWGAFLSMGDRMRFALDRLGRLRWLAVLASGLRWFAPVVWIAALMKLADTTESTQGSSNSPVGEQAFARRETKHYEFLYRTSQGQEAGPFFAGADHVYNRAAAYLDVQSLPSRIVVDLASPVITHASGQTNWTKIRIPLNKGDRTGDLFLILGHETTHVFIEQLSDGRATTHFNECRAFHEGLATYVELQLFGNDHDRALNRREIAGAWSRGKVPFELLVNNEALSKIREPNLAYPLGEAFARALVQTHGPGAPARVLRALARKHAPVGLTGAALWRDTMQAAGVSFDRVVAAYDAACDAAMKQEAGFVSALPRLAATVRVEGENIVVQPIFTGFPPGQIVCATEDDDPLAPQLTVLHRRADGAFTWPRSRQTKATFRYLLGWYTSATRLPVFEPWAEAVPK
jgi:hypothetical protein